MPRKHVDTVWTDLVRRHFDAFLAELDPDLPMWPAAVDARTGRPLDDPVHVGGVPKRCYRLIEAPGGSNLYWDMPLVSFAHRLSEATGRPAYSEAADRYVRAFLDRCVAANGLFLWGNHYFWHFDRGCVVEFGWKNELRDVDPARAQGEEHEMRPLSVDWDALFRVDAAAVERHLREVGSRHLFDASTGGFNRHADGRRDHAFIESGGIIAESLCALHARTGDPAHLDMAKRYVGYSWSQRDTRTGLVRNNPTGGRWDAEVCTTEVGLWAGTLLNAWETTGDGFFLEAADAAMRPYVRHGWDAEAGAWFGMLDVETALPRKPDAGYEYMPGYHASWTEPLFPRHDYPYQFARACLRLLHATGSGEYATAAAHSVESLLAAADRIAYAEHFGRGIDLLLDAADALDEPGYGESAVDLAGRAVELLHAGPLFRSHVGEDRADAVDGLGFLFAALMRIARP